MKKNSKVFLKVFAYTMLLVLLVSFSALFLFSSEILAFYQDEQRRFLSSSFEPIISVIADRENSPDDIAEFARRFADNNQSFSFAITVDGIEIYSTSDIQYFAEDNVTNRLLVRFADSTRESVHESITTIVQRPMGLPGLRFGFMKNELDLTTDDSTGNTYSFSGFIIDSGRVDYTDLIRRSLLAIVIMLVIAVFGAVLFAKKVTKPLEDEIIRERAMEENQRLFFSAASHELKTPIAAARALVEGMIAGVGNYRDHHKYLRECLKTLDSQANLVSEILEIVKFSGTETGEPDVFNLRELADTVLAEYLPLAEQRGLLIQNEIKQVFIAANRNLLHRVLSNVIANAVQNTREGESIRIKTGEHKKLRLSVLNTGSFIPEEVISRLFEPFSRLDTARTKHSGGEESPPDSSFAASGTQSGLGLAIVKKALDRMECPFALENTPEGVLFWVELPLSAGFRKTSDKV